MKFDVQSDLNDHPSLSVCVAGKTNTEKDWKL